MTTFNSHCALCGHDRHMALPFQPNRICGDGELPTCLCGTAPTSLTLARNPIDHEKDELRLQLTQMVDWFRGLEAQAGVLQTALAHAHWREAELGRRLDAAESNLDIVTTRASAFRRYALRAATDRNQLRREIADLKETR